MLRVAVLLLLPPALHAQPAPPPPAAVAPPKVPPELRVKLADGWVFIQAECPGRVRFDLPDLGFGELPAFVTIPPNSFAAPLARPGTYRVWCWTGTADGPSAKAETKVVVEGATPPPPGPGPNPPANDLTAKLQAAYDADAGQLDVRRGHLKILADTWAAAPGYLTRDGVGTAKQLMSAVHAAVAGQGVPDASLRPLRELISAELRRLLLPLDQDAPLDDATRKRAAEAFRRVSDALQLVRG